MQQVLPPEIEIFNDRERARPSAAGQRSSSYQKGPGKTDQGAEGPGKKKLGEQESSSKGHGGTQPKQLNPDFRSPGRFLNWLLLNEWQVILGNAVATMLWLLPGMLNPYLLGRAIDEGIVGGDAIAALKWVALMGILVVVSTITGVMQSWTGLLAWLKPSFVTMKMVSRKASQLGHVLPRRTPTGEVLSVASSDSQNFGALGDVAGRAISNVLAIGVVTVLVLRESVPLGIVVLVSAPVLVAVSGPMLKPMQRAQASERSRTSKLTSMATDIVAGLRILRGIGGEQTFGENYAQQSQRVRQAGVNLGLWVSVINAISVVLSGLLLVLLTWMGAREVLAGRLTVGQLVSFFGYATFLVQPMRTLFEVAQKYISARVSARKTVAVLASPVPWVKPEHPVELVADQVIVDEASGVNISPRKLTVLVAKRPDISAGLVSRIGRFLPAAEQEPESLNLEEGVKGKAAKDEYALRDARRAAQVAAETELAESPWQVTYGGIDLTEVPLDEVRKKILISDTSSMVFSGTLQTMLDPEHKHSRKSCERALTMACAEDVYQLMHGGWQGRIDERGRGLSGGQRQRLVLARALLADPEVLALVEPTSAVDAHTEAEIANRVADGRRGKTTIVTSVSPLWLRVADEVQFVSDGKLVASGTHDELLKSCAEYRSVVARGGER